jgi:uncharacterized protein (TIGR03435 family)
MKIRFFFARGYKAASAMALIAAVLMFRLAGTSQATTATPAAPALHEIVGIWQGTLHVAALNRDLRIVGKVSKGDKGELKLMFYSIDQGPGGLAANSASFEDPVLKFSIDTIRGKYEGKMSPDGKTIAGNWTQGDPSGIPLNFDRATADNAWAIPEPPKPMPADAKPGIDVATVKPSKPGQPGKLFSFRGRSVITINTSMNDLVTFAYGLHTKQIIGAPDWFSTDQFDIDAVPDVGGQPNLMQLRLVVQSLLSDRFKLAFHHEQKELSAYLVTVSPGGPKLTKSTASPNDPPAFFFRGLGDLTVRNMDMKEFAQGMQGSVTDKPVIDQTGLTEKYDFTLKWTPDDSQFATFRSAGAPPPPPTEDPNAPPSLYTAIQEQIGLKIGPGKAPDDAIVIDHVEKPSAN